MDLTSILNRARRLTAVAAVGALAVAVPLSVPSEPAVVIVEREPMVVADRAPAAAIRLVAEQEAKCIEENGMPCSYLPNGVRNSYKAGDAGPKEVKVPKSVRAAWKKVIKERATKKQKKIIADMNWYEKGVWTLNCVQSVGMRQLVGDNYPRCLTPMQQKKRLGKMKNIYIACSQTAIVTTGIGSVWGKKKGAIWGAVGGGVSCMTDRMITLMRKDLEKANPTEWDWGFLSAIPGAAENNPKFPY